MTEPRSAGHLPRRRALRCWHSAELALGALVFFCPLAIGTVHPWAIAVATALSFLACGCTAWATVRSGEPFEFPAPALVFSAAIGFIAFQLLPLPPALVGLLAPETRALFDYVLGPLGHYPAWRPLSLDPHATARELAKALTALAAFLAAAQIVRSRRARTRVLTTVGLAGLAVALIGFGHALTGSRSLFGVFEYEQANPPFFSTFGNPNHLSSLLALGATALLARILGERDRKIATLWGFAYLATGVGVFLSLSRGGIVAFAASQLLLGVAVLRLRESERSGALLPMRRLAVPAAVTLVVAVAAYLAWEAIARELATLDSADQQLRSKLAALPGSLELLKSHPLVGVGRGAFEAAFSRFQDPALRATITHPENLVLQWSTELGVPVALALLVAFGRALFDGLRRAGASIERLACGVALAALALHELVDFGLEYAGVAVPATVLFAIATSREEAPARVERRTALALVPVAGLLACLALVYDLRSEERAGRALAAQVGKAPAAAIVEEATRLAALHPADYFPHLAAAVAVAEEPGARPEEIAAWASRAMHLSPTHPTPHRLAARALRARGHAAQARLESRLAFELGDRGALVEAVRATLVPGSGSGPGPRAASVSARPAENCPEADSINARHYSVGPLLELVPDSEGGIEALADELMHQKRPAEAQAVLEAGIAQHGEQLGHLRRLAHLAAARKDAAEVERIGERMSAAAPDGPAGLQTRVQAKLIRGDLDGAIALLQTEGLARFPLAAELGMTLADLQLRRGDTTGCRKTLKQLPLSADRNLRIRVLLMEARAAEQDGLGVKAVTFFRSAVQLRPEDARLRLQYARLLERQTRLDAAIREAEGAAAQAPELREEAAKLQARARDRKKQLEDLQRWKEAERAEEDFAF